MTTELINFSTLIRNDLHLISSTEDPAMWSHPVLDLFGKENVVQEVQEKVVHRARLYLVPTTFGEEFDDGDEPIPTSALDLPDIHIWTMKFAVSVVEIWAGRRQPAQLISHCHRFIYLQLLKSVGSQKEIGRIRTIHQNQPLDGICESTVTVRYGDRLRALVIRFEGVNEKWLCTELKLL
ncbi:unannotated protein [freshwater metagenome]|uniref:Unannotated protein n=1 Tax=freshwater metagenome TaxID=449393 RepID=A0A6J7DK58_9ZZZZ|nr:hypothetical protein [Actinomycetota bacterium]